jgi:dolichol-phosphate mannosyltransferase
MMAQVPKISVVIPLYNEAESLPLLTAQLSRVLNSLDRSSEIIYVDDGSTDESLNTLKDLQQDYPRVRVIRFARNAGQSAALAAGFRAARGEVVVTLDADLQNDPADIPKLVEKMEQHDCVCGVRMNRHDDFLRKVSSWVANTVRNAVLKDRMEDIGCGLKTFRKTYLDKIPMFNGMHRFLPTLIRMHGGSVAEVRVRHRPRLYGKPKYNIRNRILRAFTDMLAVRWLRSRRISYRIEETTDE